MESDCEEIDTSSKPDPPDLQLSTMESDCEEIDTSSKPDPPDLQQLFAALSASLSSHI